MVNAMRGGGNTMKTTSRQNRCLAMSFLPMRNDPTGVSAQDHEVPDNRKKRLAEKSHLPPSLRGE
jgi:hypothetical protein